MTAGGLEGVEARVVSLTVWHQTRPRNALLDVADPARYPGRYHRAGDPGVWYASRSERGAWAELLRHWAGEEVSPFEVRRRVGRARLEDLAMLNLTDDALRTQLGMTETTLTGDDWPACQQLGDQAPQTSGASTRLCTACGSACGDAD